MSKPTHHYVAGDYAGIEAGKYKLYFGYEQTVCKNHQGDDCENCEWAFVAWNGKQEIMRIAQSKLGVDEGCDMSEYLLAGTSRFIAEHCK